MDYWRLRLGAIALGFLLLGACTEEVTTPPAELVHTWHSKAEHMRGRSLEIRGQWVVFGADRYSGAMHPLVRVEEKQLGDAIHYTLHYRGEGDRERQLGLLYRPGRVATLQLDNRDEIWVRTEDAKWLREEES